MSEPPGALSCVCIYGPALHVQLDSIDESGLITRVQSALHAQLLPTFVPAARLSCYNRLSICLRIAAIVR